jgi:hypothetical protein
MKLMRMLAASQMIMKVQKFKKIQQSISRRSCHRRWATHEFYNGSCKSLTHPTWYHPDTIQLNSAMSLELTIMRLSITMMYTFGILRISWERHVCRLAQIVLAQTSASRLMPSLAM